MAARIYWIAGPWKGKLAIIPRPPGGDWLKEQISDLHDTGISVVVSFLTADEITELDLNSEQELCEAYGIKFISFPISDRQVPTSKAETLALVRKLKQLLINGEKVGLHCRQSVGRSALIAACLLVSAGVEPQDAFERISSARGGKVPDTTEQQQWVADLEKNMPTKGERLFEAYLLLQGITNYEFEKTHQGKSIRPDFSVTLDREFIFEVKDFEPKDLLLSGAYDPYKRIQDKIVEGSKKFREYKELSCCLVLYNNNASLIHLEEPEIMLGAMLGKYGVSLPRKSAIGEFDATTQRFGFHEGGAMIPPKINEPQNTTISALITLREVEVGPRKLGVYLERLMTRQPDITPVETFRETFSPDIDFDKHERQLGVIVWENVFARIPFPRNLFRGPYDERWGQKGNKLEIERVFVGSELAALEGLEDTETILLNTP